ncbi:MAG: aspartate aminotransferase family protein [Lachnospiraceae bacterium]|nr:aspartate aminotransferase family protein [Lachnospiraceae bacterium]
MAKSKEAWISEGEAAFYKTYNRFPVVFERGEGLHLYDTDGTEYLDFYAGIAVNALGYGDPEYTECVKEQAEKLLHISNYFYNTPSIEAGEKLTAAAQMDKVFFTNSGTEAVEGAIKIARRYAYNKDGGHDHEIIAMKNSFHGRSIGALSVTGNDHYQEPFKPLLSGIKFAQFNDLDSVKALFNEKTCAVIMETVQGEGGIYPARKEFIEGVRALCDEHDALLILDEIQCGMGRTGHMFAWQHYGVKPDVMTVAKALGNGVPIGAFLAWGKAASAMVPGDHGTTYGGNPFVCAAASKVLDIFQSRDLTAHVTEIGEYLWERLEEVKAEYPAVKAHRGMGLMQGLEFDQPVGPIVTNALLEQKLVLISAGANIIRFIPPLVIEKSHVDEMIVRLKKAIENTR